MEQVILHDPDGIWIFEREALLAKFMEHGWALEPYEARPGPSSPSLLRLFASLNFGLPGPLPEGWRALPQLYWDSYIQGFQVYGNLAPQQGTMPCYP
jgi:hypothetical protein